LYRDDIWPLNGYLSGCVLYQESMGMKITIVSKIGWNYVNNEYHVARNK